MTHRGLLMLSMLALVACTTPVKTRYYTLSGAPLPLENAARPVPEYRVGIGPVTMPEILDRPQIVLTIAPNRQSILDTDRWAEPLKHELPYLLAEEIGQLLPAASVAAYLQYGGQNADYRVLIDVLRFDSVPGASITLEAAWSVRSRAGVRLREARAVFVEPVHAPGVPPLVSAHGKALAALARDIAAAVDVLARAKQ